MLLRDLVAGAGGALAAARLDAASGGLDITGVTHDSRAVTPGALFCCVRGVHSDGHDYARAAVRAGAVALVCERPVGAGAVELIVPDSRLAMATAAATFHGHPSRALRVVGVTGTNGKTTTVHLIDAILNHAGVPTATIGTLTGTRTTPESTELQARLASFRDAGVRAVAMEVSSHALVQQRVAGTVFAAVAFTNLSRDHLDYHASMEEYFKAKASLFTASRARVAVIDVDGPYGRLLASTTDIADVVRTGASHVEILEVGAAGSRFRWRGQEVHLPLGGRFNIANAAVAAEVALSLGIAPEVVAAGLATSSRVPGRFEQVEVDAPYRVVVDYAHTPDGLEHVLAAAREVAGDGRVLVVFGCGGERDTTKRPMMGRAAEEGADVVVVTSDNPRSEDPQRIIGDILTGFDRRPWLVEPDRRAAIRAALGEAGPGDIVVIAGKGHETTQEIGTRVHPFDDRAVAALEARQVRGGA